MGNERYPRETDVHRDYDNRREPRDYGRDYGSGRYGNYSGGRNDAARGDNQRGYGSRDYGNQRYAQRDQSYGQGYGPRDGGRDYDDGQRNRYAGDSVYHGSYASDGRRFDDVGRYRHADDDNRSPDRSYGGQPQGYDYQDRGFFQRAGDEVRSWFGDDDAERRRNEDARRDERYYGSEQGTGHHHDADYHGWRSTQIAALDRDYDEYRRENRTKFESEFASWRTNRQGQRDQLNRVTEHMDVVGSDGEHVGTVDKVRGDRIILTKNDVDAGGHHHSIPSSWLQSVDSQVTLAKTAAEAKRLWQDEERQAMFRSNNDDGRDDASRQRAADRTPTARTY